MTKHAYVLESYDPMLPNSWILHKGWASTTYHPTAKKTAKGLSTQYPQALFRVRAPGDGMRAEYIGSWYTAGEQIDFETSDKYLDTYKVPPEQERWRIQEFYPGNATSQPRWYDKDIEVTQRATLAALATSDTGGSIRRGIRPSDGACMYWQDGNLVDPVVVAGVIADSESFFKERQKWIMAAPHQAQIHILADYVQEPGINGIVRFYEQLAGELEVLAVKGKPTPDEQTMLIEAARIAASTSKTFAEGVHDALVAHNEKTSDQA